MPLIKYPKYLERGMKFGRLTVIEVNENSKFRNNKKIRPSMWKYKCVCDCGNTKSISKDSLVGDHTKSCGCLSIEELRGRRKGNKIEICENHIKIFLSNCNKFTLIDKEDYEKVKDYTWSLNNLFYVRARDKDRNIITLHRLIMGFPKNMLVDHRDHNTLNNKKQNLRICTQQQNLMNSKIPINNSSGHKGVSWCERLKRWRAYIKLDKKQIYLGSYNDKQDAIKAREEAEIKYFGEYRYNGAI